MKYLRLALWACVMAVAGGLAVKVFLDSQNKEVAQGKKNDGRAFIEIRWEHLPDVERFNLIERSGRKLDSAEFAGKPYAINIFFTSCPTICRDFNGVVKSLSERHRDKTDMTFVSISCQPDTDTPEILTKYADSFFADPERWLFLTGSLHDIKQLGQQSLQVIVDPNTHNEDIMLIDRWGRYRDRFEWDDPREIKRFAQVLDEVLAEKEPPFGKLIKTRNVMAGPKAYNAERIPWIRDFRLRSAEGGDFYSRQLTGKVWVASLFFTNCGTVCPQMNGKLAQLQDRFKKEQIDLVSITTRAKEDTAPVLRKYAKELGADPDHWHFLTGNQNLIERISAEFFGVHSEGDHHSSELFLVDRWGKVRGRFDWRSEDSLEKLFDDAEKLNNEKTPYDYLKSESVSKGLKDQEGSDNDPDGAKE